MNGSLIGNLARSRGYVLGVLTAIYVVNYINRQILNILLPEIKAEFHLSDSELGLLAGPVFGAVYAVMGLPLARLADRVNRRNLIAATLALFSFATFVSAYVGNFSQLLVARFCTGLGEAGTFPAAVPMISDLYPAGRRARPLGIYSAGLNLGLLIAFFGGSWVAEIYGWRAALMSAGVPGLVLTALVLLTVPEPRRGGSEDLPDQGDAPGIQAALRHLFALRSFRWLTAGAALSAFAGYAGLAFNPSFLARSHHLTPAEIGLALALLTGVVGFAGTLGAGILADLGGKRDMRWLMWVPMLGSLLAVPFFPIAYLTSSLPVALAALIVPVALSTTYMPPCFAAGQSLAPLRMRGKAQAVFLFVVNMVGLGLGPQWVGIASDLLRPAVGPDSLRDALASTAIPLLASAWCFWRAAGAIREDIRRVANA